MTTLRKPGQWIGGTLLTITVGLLLTYFFIAYSIDLSGKDAGAARRAD